MPDMEQLEMNGVVYDVRDPTKAPAGYGLGERAKDVTDTDLNSYMYGGFYAWSSATNAPFFWGYMEVIPFSTGEGAWQRATSLLGDMLGCIAQRVCHSWGTWSEWEWVNPPMVLGVEYRTTERHEGKVVYKKKVSVGALPNATTKTFASLITRFTGIVGYRMMGYTAGAVVDMTTNCYFNTTEAGITMTANADASAYSGVAHIEYIKD